MSILINILFVLLLLCAVGTMILGFHLIAQGEVTIGLQRILGGAGLMIMPMAMAFVVKIADLPNQITKTEETEIAEPAIHPAKEPPAQKGDHFQTSF